MINRKKNIELPAFYLCWIPPNSPIFFLKAPKEYILLHWCRKNIERETRNIFFCNPFEARGGGVA